MNRLTFEGNFCDIVQCRALDCPFTKGCSAKQVLITENMHKILIAELV